MCDSTNFRALYFDPSKAGAMQSGVFSHPCLPEHDPKPSKKTSSGKDGLAMMSLVRQNDVGTVMLYGTPIVSLFIDDQERLCLAQISNTLLKDFSYNEIHNRRVALGITCLQCTPVQLEILRRAGAMPVSSRRCGLITKREAERLVKSFLEDIAPPQLPDDFKFEVYHECGWGCRGSFMPSRYNSSRAKCIECYFCKGFFSPNKFIFHYHRSHSASYRHPDAANFNSWRRHLKLCDPTPTDALVHAWEDVKAMFNGGSRKRMLSSPQKSQHSPKLPNHGASPTADDIGFYSFPQSTSSFPYYPYMSAVADPMQLQRLTQGPGMHPAFPRGVSCPRLPSFQSYGDVLRSLSAPYTMMWMQQQTLPKPDVNFLMRACEMEESCLQEHKLTKDKTEDKKPVTEDGRRQNVGKGDRHVEMVDSSSNDSERFTTGNPFLPSSSCEKTKKERPHETMNKDCGKASGSDDDTPIDVVEEETKGDNLKESNEALVPALDSTNDLKAELFQEDPIKDTRKDSQDVTGVDSSGRLSEPLATADVTSQSHEDMLAVNGDCSLTDLEMEMAALGGVNYSSMPIDELQSLLGRARKAREHAERRNKRLQGSLEDTLRREARIKQELSEQIAAMRGTLSSEIEQEKKAKELIQLRLKGRPKHEVHDALQNISGGLQTDDSAPCFCSDAKTDNSEHN